MCSHVHVARNNTHTHTHTHTPVTHSIVFGIQVASELYPMLAGCSGKYIPNVCDGLKVGTL